jgi:hypothetical protein
MALARRTRRARRDFFETGGFLNCQKDCSGPCLVESWTCKSATDESQSRHSETPPKGRHRPINPSKNLRALRVLRASSSCPSSGGIPARSLTSLLALATFGMLSKSCR